MLRSFGYLEKLSGAWKAPVHFPLPKMTPELSEHAPKAKA